MAGIANNCGRPTRRCTRRSAADGRSRVNAKAFDGPGTWCGVRIWASGNCLAKACLAKYPYTQAQVNEILCKALRQNLSCLAQAMHRLGIEPMHLFQFRPFEVYPLRQVYVRTDFRPAEVSLFEIRPSDFRPSEVRPCEVRPFEICPFEVCPFEVRILEVCPFEARPYEFRL